MCARTVYAVGLFCVSLKRSYSENNKENNPGSALRTAVSFDPPSQPDLVPRPDDDSTSYLVAAEAPH